MQCPPSCPPHHISCRCPVITSGPPRASESHSTVFLFQLQALLSFSSSSLPVSFTTPSFAVCCFIQPPTVVHLCALACYKTLGVVASSGKSLTFTSCFFTNPNIPLLDTSLPFTSSSHVLSVPTCPLRSVLIIISFLGILETIIQNQATFRSFDSFIQGKRFYSSKI